MIRLIATDLDGTLWGPDMVVPRRHAIAISELVNRGITVLAATSRRPLVVRRRLQDAGLSLPAVLVDGAIGVDFRTGARFHEAAFEPIDAVATLAGFRSGGLEPCLCVDDSDSGVGMVISDSPSSCAAHLASLGGRARVEDLEVAAQWRRIYAFSVLGIPRARLAPAANLLITHGVEVNLYADSTYGDYGLIVSPPGISKWTGISAYCRLSGIHAEEVLAVGDGDNDISMLGHAGIAVGIKGGSQRALALADYLIASPCEEGWAALADLV